MLEIKGKYSNIKIMIDDIEETALKQLYIISNHPSTKNQNIVIMPDVHAGNGSVIGFTMTLGESIVPNWIGVDIGCGVLSIKVNNISKNKDNLLRIDSIIRNNIPMGNKLNTIDNVRDYFKLNFNWDETTELARQFIMKYNKKFKTSYDYVRYTYDWFLNKQQNIKMLQNAELGIGTLGGGNHFIEIGEDENNDTWITVHTGSRNFGKMICDYHQKIAKNILSYKRNNLLNNKIKEIKNKYKGQDIKNHILKIKNDLNINFDINIKGLEFLNEQPMIDYFMDMIFAQKYAEFNRNKIIDTIVNKLNLEIIEKIESVHNYIDFKDMIIRKGSISSYKHNKMVIPFSMGDGLIICEGKSNKQWNYSAPHGSGRIMSRGKASKSIDLNTFKKRMKGIVSTSVKKSTIDESPMVYKNPDIIKSLIFPTISILHKVKPLLNIKDNGEIISWKEKKLKIKKEKEIRQLRYQKMKKF